MSSAMSGAANFKSRKRVTHPSFHAWSMTPSEWAEHRCVLQTDVVKLLLEPEYDYEETKDVARAGQLLLNDAARKAVHTQVLDQYELTDVQEFWAFLEPAMSATTIVASTALSTRTPSCWTF